MFGYHHFTLKEGFQVKSGATKLSKFMYDIVLDVDLLQKRATFIHQTLSKGLYIRISSRFVIYRKLQMQ